MDLRMVFVMAVLSATLVGLAVPAGTSKAQTAKDVVGTWTMVSNVTDQGGTKTEPYGANPKGIMVLDASGHYIIAVSRSDLPKFASNNRTKGTTEENAAVVHGSIFHFGTYSVNEADKTLNFHIETSTFANWNGAEQKRPLTLTGDELKYTIASGSAGGTVQVAWKRSK